MARVNGIDTDKVAPFLKRIETLNADIESAKGAHAQNVKTIKDDIKEVLTEAEEAGIPKRALKGLVKYRELERRQDEIGSGLEGEDERAYDALVDQLGELGKAAKERASRSKSDESRASH